MSKSLRTLFCIMLLSSMSAETYAAFSPSKVGRNFSAKSLKPFLAQRAYNDMQLRHLNKLANTKKIDSETLFARLQKLHSQ